jgi:hypothetical protein
MKKYLQTFLMTIFTISLFGFIPLSHSLAQSDTVNAPRVLLAVGDKVDEGLNSISAPFPNTIVAKEATFAEFIRKVIEYALYFSAIIAVLFIIYGGYQYIFSAGADDVAKAGRKTLINALAGLVIIVLAYVMVQVVYSFLTTPN